MNRFQDREPQQEPTRQRDQLRQVIPKTNHRKGRNSPMIGAAFNDRFEFLVFVKILLKCVEKSQQYLVLQQVRLVVMTCTRGNRMGDPSFCPLLESIKVRLHKLVGDRQWKQACHYTRVYLQKKRASDERKKAYFHPPQHRQLMQNPRRQEPPRWLITQI